MQDFWESTIQSKCNTFFTLHLLDNVIDLLFVFIEHFDLHLHTTSPQLCTYTLIYSTVIYVICFTRRWINPQDKKQTQFLTPLKMNLFLTPLKMSPRQKTNTVSKLHPSFFNWNRKKITQLKRDIIWTIHLHDFAFQPLIFKEVNKNGLTSIESWLVDRDPYNGLLWSIFNWVGNFIPYIPQTTRVLFIAHLAFDPSSKKTQRSGARGSTFH